MRVLVCGGREFSDAEFLFQQLDRIHALTPISVIIEGAARGADSLAREWAISREVEISEYPAKWNVHKNNAGFVRNLQMLNEGKPDVVVAFDGGKGTAHMKRIAKTSGIKVVELKRGLLDG
jgi:hypothetical protein